MNYDIVITEEGTEYGFVLAKPESTGKQLSISEVGPPPADRLVTAEQITHTDFPPEIDAPFVMTSWINGVGQLLFDNNDDKSFIWSTGLITNVDGKVYLAPPVTEIPINSYSDDSGGGSTLIAARGDDIKDWTTVLINGVRYDWMSTKRAFWRRDASDPDNEWELFARGVNSISDDRTRRMAFYRHPDDGDLYIFLGDGSTLGSTYRVWNELSRSLPVSFADLEDSQVVIGEVLYADGGPTDYIVVGNTMYAARGALEATGFQPDNKVFFSTDPLGTVDNFSGPIVVGDALTKFQHVVAVNDFLFIFNQSAGYSIDAEQAVREIFWHFKHKPSPLNYQFVATDGYFLYYSIGTEVFAYEPNSGINVALGIARKQSFSMIDIVGLAADEKFVYILANIDVPLAGGTRTALLAAYPTGEAQWSLEVLWEESDDNKIHSNLTAVPDNVSSDTRLYWGTQYVSEVETVVSSMIVPSTWDGSGGNSFAQSASLYTSITHANFPGFTKRAIWLSTDGDIPEDTSIAVYYSMDEGSTWTQLDFDTSTGGIQNVLSSPAVASLSNDSSRNILLRFDLSGDGTNTPVLNEFDLHQRVQFRYLQLITCGVRVADNLNLRNGSKDINRKATEIKADLEFLRASENNITYRDFLGNEFPVTIDRIDYVPSRDEKPTSDWEVEAVVRMIRSDYGD